MDTQTKINLLHAIAGVLSASILPSSTDTVKVCGEKVIEILNSIDMGTKTEV